MLHCPICEVRWYRAPTACVCGFNFETQDTRIAIRNARAASVRANTMWITGGVMVFLAPALMFHQINAITGMIGGLLGTGGALLAVFGILRGDAAKKCLTRAKERNQLPTARVVD